MEDLVTFGGGFRARRVWVSGHTGFKGSWLCQWLLDLGAEIFGFSLAPEPGALFEQLELATAVHHEIGDVRDPAAVRRSIDSAKPDYVFHLAAQPIVRESYRQPVATYATNVMGTVHVLEALRALSRPCAAVFVTTDKCYENREWLHAYRETDALGGYDPYSSSKAMAELAIAAYRQSFFRSHAVKVASARAGNVIGGGDWACDRILPDCIRALQAGEPIPVRNPLATRPWQHVLEPLSGYLCLARALATVAPTDRPTSESHRLDAAFNFGPGPESNRSVQDLVMEVLKHWPGSWTDRSDPSAPHEAGLLKLSIEKAQHLLGWTPVWSFPRAVETTVRWYREAARKVPGVPSMTPLTQRQIRDYCLDATRPGSDRAGGTG